MNTMNALVVLLLGVYLHQALTLLPDTSSHRQPVSSRTRELEEQENRNRKHVWDWLDRLHNERRNGRSGGQKLAITSFMTTPPTEKKNIADQRKRTRDASAVDTSPDVDYADDDGAADYFDQMKPESGISSTASPQTRPRSSTSTGSLSSVLKFSSNRTGLSASNVGTLQRLHRLKNPKKRLTSSVLNLPPVKQDWSFQCPTGQSGWFADAENDCRVYYVCSSDRGERQRFVCPTGTRFNEEAKNCDWWDKVQCGEEGEG